MTNCVFLRIKKAARRGHGGGSLGSGGIFANIKQSLGSGSSSALGPSEGLPHAGASSAAVSLKLGPAKPSLFGQQGPSPFGSGSWPLPLSGGSGPSPPPSEYLTQLSSLNNSVSQWISRHVASNPYVDLTPIFMDYKKHLKDIDIKVSELYGAGYREQEYHLYGKTSK